MATYKDYSIDISPTWLQEPNGESFTRGYAQLKDMAIDDVRQAVLERMPNEASPLGLELIGAERQLGRGVSESEAAYRARLIDAWTQWQYAGTAFGVLKALRYAGYTNVYILVHNGEYYSLDTNGDFVKAATNPPILSTNPNYWNVFSLIFPATLPSGWVPTVPAEFSDEMENIRRLVKLWKAAHAIFDSIYIFQSGSMWGFPPTQNWGAGGLTWGGSIIQYQGE